VAAGDQAGEGKSHDAVRADDCAVDIPLDALEQLCRAPGLEGRFLRRRHDAPV